jgi:hypothetical protein
MDEQTALGGTSAEICWYNLVYKYKHICQPVMRGVLTEGQRNLMPEDRIIFSGIFPL